jgi:argininosuccinate lyase
MTDASRPLWHGRLGSGPAPEMLAFTASLPFDVRLAADDIEGSRAHVRMLADVGLLTGDERDTVLAALDQIESEIDAGRFVYAPTDEDVHTAVERRVTELAGAAGAKLHTGRSRNDQVAVDLRLYLRREGRGITARLVRLQAVLLERAEAAGDAYLPGYTHLQRAQPVLLAHHLLAYFWMLARDVDRWQNARRRADVSPLGAGALAGTSLPIDPDTTAAALGFHERFHNSLDAVADRDFVAEALFVLALTQVHLSRLGEELVLWASAEFGFVSFPDSYATGSSMLPHKKNPDIAELTRAKAGRLIGNLTGLLATMKGLPLSYNLDLQEDKEALFDSIDTANRTLAALTGLMETIHFERAAMQLAADSEHGAVTDLAEHLVGRGVPFRDAHAKVGALVREALTRKVPLRDLVAADPDLGADAVTMLEPGAAVRRRLSPGGGGPQPVAAQLAAAHRHLADARAALGVEG